MTPDPDSSEDVEFSIVIPLPAITTCAYRSSPEEYKREGREDPSKVRRFQVSIKRLAEVSPFFNQWSELPSLSPGYFEFEVVDLDAFGTVLDFIHNRFTDFPLKVGLVMMAKIADIVDYLQCQGVLGESVQQWIKTAWEKELNIVDDRPYSVLLWIYITLVFKDAERFEITSKEAILAWPGRFRSYGLRLPQYVVNEINTRRDKTITNVISITRKFARRQIKGETGCSHTCQSVLYGSLCKQLPFYFFIPPLLAPTISVSLDRIIDYVIDLERPQWASCANIKVEDEADQPESANTSSKQYEEHPCGFEQLMREVAYEFKAIEGFSLRVESEDA